METYRNAWERIQIRNVTFPLEEIKKSLELATFDRNQILYGKEFAYLNTANPDSILLTEGSKIEVYRSNII